MSKSSKGRLVERHQAMASQKVIKSSPRKLNLVAQLIRGKQVDEAIKILMFCEKRVAADVTRVLHAAIANAENNHGLDVDSLIVDEAYVGKSMVLKRFHVRGRGRVNEVQKSFSNIKIIVGEKESA